MQPPWLRGAWRQAARTKSVCMRATSGTRCWGMWRTVVRRRRSRLPWRLPASPVAVVATPTDVVTPALRIVTHPTCSGVATRCKAPWRVPRPPTYAVVLQGSLPTTPRNPCLPHHCVQVVLVGTAHVVTSGQWGSKALARPHGSTPSIQQLGTGLRRTCTQWAARHLPKGDQAIRRERSNSPGRPGSVVIVRLT